MPASTAGAKEGSLALAILLGAAAVAGHVGWLLMLSGDPWALGFRELWRTDGTWRVGVALLASQLLVLASVARRCKRIWLTTPPLPAGWALAVAIMFMVAAATAVPSRPMLFPAHLAYTSMILGAAWLSLGAAAHFAGPAGLDRAADRLLESRSLVRWVAAWAVIATSSIWWLVFDGIPHIPDEVVYLLQAKYLATGSLYLTGIPAGALDAISTISEDGRWFGIFPFGWPAILALGVALGAPWLLNPLLSGAVVFAAHDLVRRVYDRRSANLAVFLLGTSPWFLFLGGSLMAHTASILAGALALRGALGVADDRKAVRWALVGGLSLGLLVLMRPFEGVLVGLLAAGVVVEAHRMHAVAVAPVMYAGASLAVGALTLLYNRATTGSALLDPITLYFDRVYYPGANRLGFGSTVGNVGWGNDALAGHSPVEAVINANWNTSLVQIELFGWAFGSLLVVVVWLLHKRLGAFRSGPLMPAAVLLVIAGYTLYWYSAADFGPRYWSQIIIPLAAITAHALCTLPHAARLRSVVVLASLVGMPVVVATRGSTKYGDYRGMTRDLELLAREEGFGRDLVLIRGDVFSDYSPGLIMNPPTFEGPGPLFFRHVEGAELDALRERFPGRPLRIVDGPSVTGGRPQVTTRVGPR
ncbi:MAG: hypothetical protein WEB90_04565 [Gemmatimonadota bacterium]